jgi:hypothetical protein
MEFKSLEGNLTSTIQSLFGKNLVHLQWSRLGLAQVDYVPLMTRLCINGDRLVWFTQNDDHVYLNTDREYISKGLEIMRKDYSLFKSMYVSHWPEALLVSGKFTSSDVHMEGDYVKTRTTILDSIQIFNAAYLNYLFVDFNWNESGWHPGMPRIDGLIYDTQGGSTTWTNPGVKDKHLQTMWVPLREFCRKFDGYSRMQISNIELFPKLELPASRNAPNSRGTLEALRHIYLPGVWGSAFRIPNVWVDVSLALYQL